MSSSRFSMEGRPHLVLVRGGLDPSPADGGPDWQDFCHRIGWQTPGSEPADDFEERLAERLCAKAPALDNVVRLDRAREGRVHEATLASFGQPGEQEHTPARRGRIGVAAASALAVAAVVFLVVARMVTSSSPVTAAALPEPPTGIVRGAPVAPSAERPSPSAAEVAPDPHAPQPTVTPSPSPGPRRDAKPTPPGARMATRSTDSIEGDGALAPRPLTASYRAKSDLATNEAAPAGLRDEPNAALRPGADSAAQVVASADWPVAWRTAREDRVVAPPADSVALAPAAVRASTDVWSTGAEASGAPPRDRAGAASKSWSLSPASDGWFGATVPPPLPRGAAPASIGVMAQLDLGKALGKL